MSGAELAGRRAGRMVFVAVANVAGWSGYHLNTLRWRAEQIERFACARYGCGGQLPREPRPRVEGSIAATGVRPDGSAVLSPDDLLTVLSALQDGAVYRSAHADAGDLADAAAYRALSRALGDTP